jgi:dTDP-glucose pyrophosphorylase
VSALSLVMPMAGRGSRFQRNGVAEPKPLIPLDGRPFFWWAAESVRRAAPVEKMAFVVLQEHCQTFGIDRRILEIYPDAQIVAIPEVTSGAAETALIGIQAIEASGPIAVNDCDHAFLCPGLEDVVGSLDARNAAALLCFRSDSAAYSYARMDDAGQVSGTVEKQPVSPYAIAGCYLFADAATFTDIYEDYRQACPYDELFVSGLFNQLLARDRQVLKADLSYHCSFGTPEEHSRVELVSLRRMLPWDRVPA